MHVSAILKTKGSTIVTIRPEESISAVTQLLAVNRIGAVLCMNTEGEIVGVLSERDIVRGLAAHGPSVLTMPASELMTRRVMFCRPEDTIASVMERMTDGRFRHMPVMEGGKLVGFISIGDVVKHRIEEVGQEVESLRDYVAGQF